MGPLATRPRAFEIGVLVVEAPVVHGKVAVLIPHREEMRQRGAVEAFLKSAFTLRLALRSELWARFRAVFEGSLCIACREAASF